MSQLNNRNSYPTIPTLLGNRVDSLEHSTSHCAGLSLNMIHFSDKRIKSKMIELNNFIITLCRYIDKVCNVLKNECNKYIRNIQLENISIEFYKEYKTVLTIYEKLVKDLKSFLSDIQKDFNKQVLKWLEDLDSSKQRYIDITKESDGLERNRHMYQDNDFEFDSDRAKSRQLYWKKYLNLKSQKDKTAQLYNKRFADLNQFIVKISILISHITEGRIFYTPIFNSHKNYTISLKDFVDEFGKLVNMTDAAMKKKGEVIAKLINESMKNLDKMTETFDVNAIMELKQIRLS
ncbi:GSCOCT00014125001.2-RA-CDS [Cotesia congregata]|uniref:Cc_35a_2 n=1 Tax=Cotesia congregata TaxID=51543 RepID=A0A8J2MKK5_COTCN|nr:GSCOCT00014125001.2-RA-CDS [Cotesia congregata]CAG5089966.1 Cc_35a_2 [Cotesia congregata]